MTKFLNNNVIYALKKITEQNSIITATELTRAKLVFQGAVWGKIPSNGIFVWLAKPDGTVYLQEEQVFLDPTPSYHTLFRTQEEADGRVLAYLVEPKCVENNQVYGDLYVVDFDKYCERVKQKAVSIESITEVFENGSQIKYAKHDFCGPNNHELRNYIRTDLNPVDPGGYQRVLEEEKEMRADAKEGDFEEHIAELRAGIYEEECR